MAKFYVLHRTVPTFRSDVDDATRAYRMDQAVGEDRNFRLVAEVEAPELGAVFGLTNHMSRPWTENEGVEAKSTLVRSTSVGDIVIDVAADRAYLVAGIGYEELPKVRL